MIVHLLRILGWIWLLLAAFVILVSYGMIWYRDGFFAVTDLLSPFNLLNWGATLMTIAPGLGLLWLGDRLAMRAEQRRVRP